MKLPRNILTFPVVFPHRLATAIAVALFIGAAIILPAVHKLHCAENHATHEAGSCLICRVASAPTITVASVIAPVAESIVSDNEVLQASIIPAASLRDPTQARAPPACPA
jgi:ABC-type methionine transport system permease subunit